jgi:mannan endo-1,4-beta-mannosidase
LSYNNSYDYSNSATWYPGDEYVDIVAYDKYNVEYNRGDGKSSGPNLLAIPAKFDSLYRLTNGKKMVAMAENDTIPALDNLLVEDAGWLYFCPWYDGGEDGGTAFLGENYQDYDELKKIYQSDYCITLDELPLDLYSTKEPVVIPDAPEIASIDYSEKYHQVRFTWKPVEGATNYGIAVYLAGKWRIQTQSISASTTTYTTPKNLTPGKSYRVAIAAKVNGQWTAEQAIKHAVTITVK